MRSIAGLVAAARSRHQRIMTKVGRLIGPKDCRKMQIDPLRAVCRYGVRGVVVEMPLRQCRTFGAIGFVPTPQSDHPYFLTARAYLEGRLGGYAGSPLETYYDRVQPRTAADLLGLPGVAKLEGIEALSADLPWLASPGEQVKEKRALMMAADSEDFGPPLTLDDGWNNIGPVSKAKADLEIRRIFAVVDSLARNGYTVDAPSNHVLGFLLRNEDDHAAVIWGGEHRIPALAALGYESVPLLFFPHRIADRRAVDTWPAVREGALSREQALQVFDRIFSGQLPAYVQAAWRNAGVEGGSASTL